MNENMEMVFVSRLIYFYKECMMDEKSDMYGSFIFSFCKAAACIPVEDRKIVFEDIDDLRRILRDNIFEDSSDFYDFIQEEIQKLKQS